MIVRVTVVLISATMVCSLGVHPPVVCDKDCSPLHSAWHRGLTLLFGGRLFEFPLNRG